jgi:hypothetical protein
MAISIEELLTSFQSAVVADDPGRIDEFRRKITALFEELSAMRQPEGEVFH